MGFSIGNSQLLVAPPYAFGVVLMVLCAWVGDKYRVRGPILIVNSFIAIIGLIVMTWAKSSGTRYFGTFLVTAGINSNVPTSMAYQANNIRGQWNRAAASCILVFGGGIGGVAGSLIFRSMDAPRYLNGVYGCIWYVGFRIMTLSALIETLVAPTWWLLSLSWDSPSITDTRTSLPARGKS